MPRPGPRPYECVRRAWHSERHQPMRGSLIQELFRVANELHNPATRKNKEWQQKLPFVVLKAEEIMYSKANSEAEYMDLTTLLDRAKDAIDTIIRRDESEDTGDLLEPCIEAALNLGCVPRRASRSQRHNSPRCYLTPASQQPPPPPSQPLEPPRNLSSLGSTPAGNLGSPYHHHHGPYSRLSLPVATQLPTNPPPGTNPQQQQPPPPPQHCSFQFPSRYQAFRQMPHQSSAGHCGGSAPVTVRFAGPSPTMIHEHANSFMPLSRGGGGFPYPASPLEHARVTQDKQRHQQFLFPRTEPRSNPCPYSGQNRAYTQYYIPSPNCQSTGLQQLPTPQNVGRCDYAGGAAPGGLGPPCAPRSGFLYNFLSSDSNKGGGPQEEEPPLCVGSVSENTHATESFDLSLRLGRSSDQGFSGSWNQEVDDQSSSCSYGQGKLRDLNCPPISL